MALAPLHETFGLKPSTGQPTPPSSAWRSHAKKPRSSRSKRWMLRLKARLSFQINVSSRTGSDSLQVSLLEGAQQGYDFEVLFSSFDGVDFTGVTPVALSGGRFVSGTTFVLNSATTVPEPQILGLLSLASLVASRRRRY